MCFDPDFQYLIQQKDQKDKKEDFYCGFQYAGILRGGMRSVRKK